MIETRVADIRSLNKLALVHLGARDSMAPEMNAKPGRLFIARLGCTGQKQSSHLVKILYRPACVYPKGTISSDTTVQKWPKLCVWKGVSSLTWVCRVS